MSDFREGGCSCGEVRYRLTSEPLFTHCCHCLNCQRQTGSAFVINLLIETDRVELLAGEPQPVDVPRSGGKKQRIFRCPTCQVAVFSRYTPRGHPVRSRRHARRPVERRPDVHIYTRSKLSWVTLPDSVPAFATYYDTKKLWPARVSSAWPSCASRTSEEVAASRSRGGPPTRGGSRLANRRYARRASRIASTNPSARRGAKPSSHQRSSTCTRALSPVDPRLEPADEAVAEEHWQHVPTPAALRGRHEELPHVVEAEEAPEEAAVPDQRVERGEERDRGRRLGRPFERRDLLAEDEALCAHTLHLDRNELPALDELLAQSVAAGIAGHRGSGFAGPRPPKMSPPPPTPSRPWARYRDRSLCRSCSCSGNIAGEHVGRQQPFEEVVVPAVAVTPREAEHARHGVRLEHGAHGVRRHPEPVGRRPALTLEIERRQRAVRADSLEHPLGHFGVLLRGSAPGLPAQDPAEPRELAHRDEG